MVLKNIGQRLGSRRDRKKGFNWNEKNAALVSLINSGNVSEAVRVGQELVEYVDRTYRKDSTQKATTYNNMGMVFMLAQDYPLAEKCFKEALAMRKRIFGENHNEVAVILLNLAQLYKTEAQDILVANRLETAL